MLARFLSGALALLALPLISCASSSGGAMTGGGSETASVCDTDKRAEVYAVGLSAKSKDGSMKATFMDANPAPPAKGLNTWTIQVTDATNKPVAGASITLLPFMPDHGHGSSITPQIKAMPTAGMYQITLVDLFMPGIWTNTFTIKPASGAAETMVFTFCIDG